jgi:hypothetical protein
MEKLASSTTADNALHIVGIRSGEIRHRIREGNGSWTPWGKIGLTDGTQFTEITCAAQGNNLHVTAIGTTGIVWHTIRFANGSWQNLAQLPDQPLLSD